MYLIEFIREFNFTSDLVTGKGFSLLALIGENTAATGENTVVIQSHKYSIRIRNKLLYTGTTAAKIRCTLLCNK